MWFPRTIVCLGVAAGLAPASLAQIQLPSLPPIVDPTDVIPKDAQQILKKAGVEGQVGLGPGGVRVNVAPKEHTRTVVGLASLLGDEAPPVVRITLKPVVVVPAKGEELDHSAPALPASAPRAALTTASPGIFTVRLTAIRKLLAEQANLQWCWAACAQIVDRYYGLRLLRSRTATTEAEQAELARYFRGTKEDQTADLTTILRAINPELEKTTFKNSLMNVGVTFADMTTDRMLVDLSAGHPVLVGLEEEGGGHACVVIGATYSRVRRNAVVEAARDITGFLSGGKPGGIDGAVRGVDGVTGDGDYGIHSIDLWDPFPGRGNRTLSGEELKARGRFLVSKELARTILVPPTAPAVAQAKPAKPEKPTKSEKPTINKKRSRKVFGIDLGAIR